MVAVLGEFNLLALQLAAAELDRDREVVDLGAGIVVVVLAGHGPALGRKDLREHITKRALARVAEVQGTGRIGVNILDDHGFARVGAALAEVPGLLEHCLHDFLLRRLGEPQVDEAGAGDFG